VTNTSLDFFLRNPQLILVFILSVQSVFCSNLYPALIPFPFLDLSSSFQIKWKVTTCHAYVSTKGWGYIFNPLETLAIEEDEWLAPRPAPFNPKQDRVPILKETGCPRGRPGWAIFSALGFDPRTVEPLSSRYNADAILTAGFVGRTYITSGNIWCNLDGIFCRTNF